MIVVSNRNIITNPKDKYHLFGEDLNFTDPWDLRIAIYRNDSYEIISDEAGQLGSGMAFDILQKSMKENKRDCLIYVHGYNTTYEKAIESGLILEKIYNKEIVLFTWPSCGFTKYLDCKRRAIITMPAFDRMMEKLCGYMFESIEENNCKQKIDIMFHSMGGLIAEYWVRTKSYTGESKFLRNIIFTAIDVNAEDSSWWISKIKCTGQKFIIINMHDIALDISTLKRGRDQEIRRGNSLVEMESYNSVYIDVTGPAGWLNSDKSHAYHLGHNEDIKKLYGYLLSNEFPKNINYDQGKKVWVLP